MAASDHARSLALWDETTGTWISANADADGNLKIAGTFSAEPPVGGATEAKQDAQSVLIGALTETAPATDTASSGLSGRLQRVAQRLTSLIGLIGEVQASPTQYTLLDRLKTIATYVTARINDGSGNAIASATADLSGTERGLAVRGRALSSAADSVTVQGAVAAGATDSGNPVKQGVVFNDAPTAVATGQRVNVRGTARGGLYATSDWSQVKLVASAPNPTGNDIFMDLSGTAPQASDLQIRNTNVHAFYIPMAVAGWRDLWIWFRVASAFDQTLTVKVGRTLVDGTANPLNYLSSATVAGSTAGYFPLASVNANTSPLTGALSSGTGYHITMLQGAGWAKLSFEFSVSPTAGEIELYIERRSQ